jgi:hypothetical protein
MPYLASTSEDVALPAGEDESSLPKGSVCVLGTSLRTAR